MSNQAIIDVSPGTDWDQLVQVGLSFTQQPSWEVLGITVSSLNPFAPMAADATARYCGFSYPNQIGINHGATPPGPPEDPDLNLEIYNTAANPIYASSVVTRFLPSQIYANYPEAVQTYRKLLARCANGGVTICGGGGATNLANLLQSSADSYSSLTGLQLVTAKVSKLVLCAGKMPGSSGSPEYNIAHDAVAYSYLCANWPTPVVWAGIEMATFNVQPPSTGRGGNPLVSPIQYAYQLQGSTPEPGYSMGFIYAAQGLGSNFSLTGTSNGTMTINTGTGDNTWTSTPGNHSYLTKVASDATLQALYNSLIP